MEFSHRASRGIILKPADNQIKHWKSAAARVLNVAFKTPLMANAKPYNWSIRYSAKSSPNLIAKIRFVLPDKTREFYKKAEPGPHDFYEVIST